MLEERLGLAQTSKDLSWGPHEKHIDIIAALGMASARPRNKLGALILRMYVNNDVSAFSEAAKLLETEIRKKNCKISQKMRHKLAYQAMYELAFQNCRFCTGSGVAIYESKKTHCKHCGGSGRHVYKDGERAKALGMTKLEFRGLWEDRLGLALNIAMVAYNSVIRETNKRR